MDCLKWTPIIIRYT